MTSANEDELRQSAALQTASAMLLARQRAEDALLLAQDALRDSQERLAAALSAAGTGTFRWNLQSNAVEWDGNLEHILGLRSGRTTQSLDAFIAAVHPDDRPAVAAACERSAGDGSGIDLEFRVVWPDGTVHWIAQKATAFVDERGRRST